jgi:uncharacterized membrane protein YcaP (DUF421 family)
MGLFGLATSGGVSDWLFGPDGPHANSAQAALRALVVYAFAIFIVRLGNRRFLGRNSVFDVILSIILGAVLSRGINGSAPMLPCFAASAMLVGAHWVFAAMAFRSRLVGEIIKGQDRILIDKGQLVPEAMRHTHISEHDLLEALRIHAQQETADGIETARLERNGDISVIKAKGEPSARIVEITVEAGVQTVRIKIE